MLANSATAGQTMFMIHMCCGSRISSMTLTSAEAKPAISEMIERT
ncbi:hypothetical protein RDV64_15520 [Acuticoccus sp. MNP-M23]|nr:hypothetical protein [Acuticoccus sp. MNP-M23]WMS45165.1 hypothetical protein RDV64_15520 [Acuticoccus sp. MNP-M23]